MKGRKWGRVAEDSDAMSFSYYFTFCNGPSQHRKELAKTAELRKGLDGLEETFSSSKHEH